MKFQEEIYTDDECAIGQTAPLDKVGTVRARIEKKSHETKIVYDMEFGLGQKALQILYENGILQKRNNEDMTTEFVFAHEQELSKKETDVLESFFGAEISSYKNEFDGKLSNFTGLVFEDI